MNNLPSPYIIPGLKYRPEPKKELTSAIIVAVVCDYFKVHQSYLQKDDNRFGVLRCRQWVTYFLCIKTAASMSEISKLINRHRTTVMYTRDLIKGQLKSKTDNQYKQEHEDLVFYINNNTL